LFCLHVSSLIVSAQRIHSLLAQHPDAFLVRLSGPALLLAQCASAPEHNACTMIWRAALDALGADTSLAGTVLLERLEAARAGAVPAWPAHNGAELDAQQQSACGCDGWGRRAEGATGVTACVV
jgi:hypothetical protein